MIGLGFKASMGYYISMPKEVKSDFPSVTNMLELMAEAIKVIDTYHDFVEKDAEEFKVRGERIYTAGS
jgi:hypothetical protein